MSHNSLFLSLRLLVRVLLHGLWQKDTKSAGHWYKVVFFAETERETDIIIVLHPNKSHKSLLSRQIKHLYFPRR